MSVENETLVEGDFSSKGGVLEDVKSKYCPRLWKLTTVIMFLKQGMSGAKVGRISE